MTWGGQDKDSRATAECMSPANAFLPITSRIDDLGCARDQSWEPSSTMTTTRQEQAPNSRGSRSRVRTLRDMGRQMVAWKSRTLAWQNVRLNPTQTLRKAPLVVRVGNGIDRRVE